MKQNWSGHSNCTRFRRLMTPHCGVILPHMEVLGHTRTLRGTGRPVGTVKGTSLLTGYRNPEPPKISQRSPFRWLEDRALHLARSYKTAN